VTALIDNGSHSVLIDDGLVRRLGLRRRKLPAPQRVRLAMGEEEIVFSEWVKLRLCSEDHQCRCPYESCDNSMEFFQPVSCINSRALVVP
jgi:hypothetical protein